MKKFDRKLFDAIRGDHLEAIRLLFDVGADVNVKDETGDTPLHEAVRSDNPETTRLLLGAGADVNATNKRGETPLHEAVYYGNLEAVRLLIVAGAEVNVTNKWDMTPLDLAEIFDSPKVDDLLRKSNNEKGKTIMVEHRAKRIAAQIERALEQAEALKDSYRGLTGVDYGEDTAEMPEINAFKQEYKEARKKHPPMAGAKEGLYTLKCEVEELSREIFREVPNPAETRKEAIQVGAMALAFVKEVCDAENN